MTDSLSASEMRALVSCDYETGVLYWRMRPKSFFAKAAACASWNRRYAGKPIYTYQKKAGYECFRIGRKHYFVHRVIWALAHGEWPRCQIDHINRDSLDNRLSNLRSATQSQNMCNRSVSKSSSLPRGVYKNHRGTFRSTVWHLGVQHYVGNFKCPNEAALARDKLAAKLHGEFATLNKEKGAAA